MEQLCLSCLHRCYRADTGDRQESTAAAAAAAAAARSAAGHVLQSAGHVAELTVSVRQIVTLNYACQSERLSVKVRKVFETMASLFYPL